MTEKKTPLKKIIPIMIIAFAIGFGVTYFVVKALKKSDKETEQVIEEKASQETE